MNICQKHHNQWTTYSLPLSLNKLPIGILAPHVKLALMFMQREEVPKYLKKHKNLLLTQKLTA